MIAPEYEKILRESKLKHEAILRRMRQLARLSKKGFDAQVHAYHREVFATIDCMKCGNCCRNYGPVFRESDLKHICKSRGLPVREFFDEYLEQDPDGVGYQLRALPCPLQDPDNTCSEYEHRTLSCRAFPHTESKNIQRKLAGLALDSLYCPAAFLICEKIIENY
jgi:Fe-S-cluster containining protein